MVFLGQGCCFPQVLHLQEFLVMRFFDLPMKAELGAKTHPPEAGLVVKARPPKAGLGSGSHPTEAGPKREARSTRAGPGAEPRPQRRLGFFTVGHAVAAILGFLPGPPDSGLGWRGAL